MKCVIYLVLLSSIIFAEDIYLKSGKIYKNIKLIETKEESVTFEMNGNKYKLDMSKVAKIDEEYIYNPDVPTQVTMSQSVSDNTDPCNDPKFLQLKSKDSLSTDEMKDYIEFSKLCEDSKSKWIKKAPASQTITTYPRLPWLVVSAAAVSATVIFFGKYWDYSEAVDALESSRIDPGTIKGKRDMYWQASLVCGVIGIVTTVVALKPLEVSINNDQVALSYRIPIW